MTALIFFLVGIGLFFLLRLISRVLGSVLRKEPMRAYFLKTFPVVEMALWVGFIFWAVDSIFQDFFYYNLLMSVMVLILLLAVSWFLFRDFFAGMVIRSENALEPGQYFKTSFVEGKILNLGIRSMELETLDGERVKVPYWRLNNQLLNLPPGQEKSYSHTLTLKMPKAGKPARLKNQILAELNNMPWIISGYPPIVSISSESEEQFLVEIRVYVMREEHLFLVEKNIRDFIRHHMSFTKEEGEWQ